MKKILLVFTLFIISSCTQANSEDVQVGMDTDSFISCLSGEAPCDEKIEVTIEDSNDSKSISIMITNTHEATVNFDRRHIGMGELSNIDFLHIKCIYGEVFRTMATPDYTYHEKYLLTIKPKDTVRFTIDWHFSFKFSEDVSSCEMMYATDARDPISKNYFRLKSNSLKLKE